MNKKIIAIIVIVILFVVFLLFYNRYCEKIIFDKEITCIPKDTIQQMFYPTDGLRQSILTGTEVLNNILNNKLDIAISGTDSGLFQQELKKRLSIYQARKHHSDSYTKRHLNYVSTSLNITSKLECFNQYHDRIILAATFDYILTEFLDKRVAECTIHEVISQLHEEGYEQFGCNILSNIFKNKKRDHIIAPTQKSIILTACNDDTVGICVSTSVLIYKVNDQNAKHSLNIKFMCDIHNVQSVKEGITTLYINTYFTVHIPYSMKHCITKSAIQTTYDDYYYHYTRDPQYCTLAILANHRADGIFTAGYVVPNPQFKTLSQTVVEQPTLTKNTM